MEKFYESFLKEVRTCIDKEDFKTALQKLEEEFKMPYIPKEYEKDMITLYHTCKASLQEDAKRKYQEEDIEALLQGSVDEACQAVDLLKNSNIRKYLAIIEAYLKTEPHFLIRSLLIEALIEQGINDEIAMDYDGLEVVFIPTYVEMPQQQEAFLSAMQLVSSFYENEDPTFLMMCAETMMKEMYFRLPFSLQCDEVDSFVYAVLEYVYNAFNDREGFTRFIHEKNLANDSGFELLLCRYEI